MKKKIGSLVLAAALLIGIAAPAFAEDNFISSPSLDPGASSSMGELMVILDKGTETVNVDQYDGPAIVISDQSEEAKTLMEEYDQDPEAFVKKYVPNENDPASLKQVRTVSVKANKLAVGKRGTLTLDADGLQIGDEVVIVHIKQDGSKEIIEMTLKEKSKVTFSVTLAASSTFVILKRVLPAAK